LNGIRDTDSAGLFRPEALTCRHPMNEEALALEGEVDAARRDLIKDAKRIEQAAAQAPTRMIRYVAAIVVGAALLAIPWYLMRRRRAAQ
jgi:hypothetical protein